MSVISQIDENFKVDVDHFWIITIACLQVNSSVSRDTIPRENAQGHAFIIIEGEESDPQKRACFGNTWCWAADFTLPNHHPLTTAVSAFVGMRGRVRTACYNYPKMYSGAAINDSDKKHLCWQYYNPADKNFTPLADEHICIDMRSESIHSHTTFYVDAELAKCLQQRIMREQAEQSPRLSITYNNCSNWSIQHLKTVLLNHGRPGSQLPLLRSSQYWYHQAAFYVSHVPLLPIVIAFPPTFWDILRAQRGISYKVPKAVYDKIKFKAADMLLSCLIGDICGVKTAIAHGININSPYYGEQTAESVASRSKKMELVNFIRQYQQYLLSPGDVDLELAEQIARQILEQLREKIKNVPST